MSEFLDDRFENIEHVSSHEYFLCEQTTKKLYHACALTRLSSSLLILNFQNRFGCEQCFNYHIASISIELKVLM